MIHTHVYIYIYTYPASLPGEADAALTNKLHRDGFFGRSQGEPRLSQTHSI